MEVPATLDAYFTIVDDFLRKSFREESIVFLALKTKQTSSLSINEKNHERESDSQVMQSEVKSSQLFRGEPTSYEAIPPSTSTSVLTFSPRMILNQDGSALGKVKLSCTFDIPKVCRAMQSLILNSEGVVIGKTEIKGLLNGLVVCGRVLVNTIAPASEDVTALKFEYRRNDFYNSFGYQQNGLGSSNLDVNMGTTFFNILAGAGFEHQRLSYLEQHEGGPQQFDVLYAGVGFTGVDWCMGAKMTRATDCWTGVRLAFMQKLLSSTLVACSYNYDIVASRANICLGFSQRLQVCLPIFSKFGNPYAVCPMRSTGHNNLHAPSSLTLGSLVFAFKADNSGLCVSTLRGWFNDAIRWGVVVHKNVLQKDSIVRFGVILSVEKG